MKMEKLTDNELTALVDYMVGNSVTESGSYHADNENWLKRYKGDLFGDEVDGRSKVVSTDTRDLVEADMPSLARIFLGANDPVAFEPINQTPEGWKEAKDKQAVVKHIITNIPENFRLQFDWLKASEFQSVSALEYGCEELVESRTKYYQGITEDELSATVLAIEEDPDVESVTVTETSDDTEEFDVTLVIKYTKKRYFLRPIPSEDFIVSRNATSKNDAEIIGKRFKKKRGELIQEGFSKSLIETLPSTNDQDANRANGLKTIRFEEQGGDYSDNESYVQWANQEIEGIDCYALVDFDGDGVAERRHVIKVGNVVLVNEPFEHVPYAIISSMLMPNNLIGIPRAELTRQYDHTNSVLWRQTLDNLYSVNYPRIGYRGDVDVDSLLDIQFNSLIDMGSDGYIEPVVIPYIGDKALQVVAFMEGKKTASTGQLQANQALDADNLHKETATRFDGMQDAGSAKIELVARVIAETGVKDLWEGIAWFANHYQDTEMEIRVLGRPMTFNPTDWKHDHRIAARVGTGAGDDEKTVQNLTGIYQIQRELLDRRSTLTDEGKLYNTLAEIVRVTGRAAVEEYFNNPEMPDSMVMAERDILKQQVAAMNEQLSMSNPLAEAEQVKAQAQTQMQQMKIQYEGQLEMLKMQQASESKIVDLQAKYASDVQKLEIDYRKHLDNMKFKYVDLASEADNSLEEIRSIRTGLEQMSDEDLFRIASGVQ